MAVSFDLTRRWLYWAPAAQRWALAAMLVVGGLVLGAQWRWQSLSLASLKDQLQALEGQSKAVSTHPQGWPQHSSADAVLGPELDPKLWPEPFEGVDDWVRAAALEAAKGNGVALQRLTITRPEAHHPSGDTGMLAGKVYAVFHVAVRGSHGGLKAWQGAMQVAMPSLGVESLRWQSPPNDGTGQSVAEWTWRLWLRPPGSSGDPGAASVPVDDVSPTAVLRPPLAGAAQDPFGFAPPPPPPTPVARVEAPPPAAVQVPFTPPPLRWVTVGRLKGPDGKHRLTGHWGNEQETVTLGEGDLSPEGHKVTLITPTALELQHPDTNDRLIFRLPPPPRFETR